MGYTKPVRCPFEAYAHLSLRTIEAWVPSKLTSESI